MVIMAPPPVNPHPAICQCKLARRRQAYATGRACIAVIATACVLLLKLTRAEI